MSHYITSAQIDFHGTEEENKQFIKLMQVMNKDKDVDESDFDDTNVYIFEIVQHALFGYLEYDPENDYYTPNFDLTDAPCLIAALFPNATFSLRTSWEHSVGGGEYVLKAEYQNGKLFIWQCQTEDDLEKLDEETREKFENGDENGEINFDVLEKKLFEINGKEEYEPCRDEEYEKTFFDGEDLAEYLKNSVEDFE